MFPSRTKHPPVRLRFSTIFHSHSAQEIRSLFLDPVVRAKVLSFISWEHWIDLIPAQFKSTELTPLTWTNWASKFRNAKIGFIFQDHHLLPHLNVIENVLVPSLAQGKPSRERMDRAEALLESVGLETDSLIYRKLYPEVNVKGWLSHGPW